MPLPLPAPDPPVYCDDSAGPFVLTPPVEPDVEPPVPGLTLKESHRSPPDVVPLEPLLVPLPLPAPDPPVYCDDSAGPSVLTPPVEPDFEPPAPDPTLKESHRSPPDVVPPEPAAGAGGEAAPHEPGAGLEHVRMMPLEDRDPVPRGAGASPDALHDSGPTPASIARVSRDSITARSEESRGGFLVFRRLTGLLLGRPLRRRHTPLLESTVGKAFISVKESVRGGIQFGGGGN